jgi:glycosyltransferase involved in cell wall biosynthesis
MLRARLLDTRGSGPLAFAPVFFSTALASIVAAAMRKRIALLHVNLASGGSALRKAVTVALASALNVPIVIQLHGGGFHQFYHSVPKAMQRAIQRMFLRADRVIVLGDYWRRFMVDDIRIAARNVVIIPNGAPTPDHTRFMRPAEPPLILFLGRLDPAKGVTDLIHALASPPIAALSWVATLAGDGDRKSLKAYANKKGIGDRISLPGWVDREEAEMLLASATLFILPSHVENMPMSLIEALAHGVPSITTAVGVIPEFLTNGETAVIVKPANPAELADAIMRMLTDTSFRNQIGRCGHELFLGRFEHRMVVQRIVAVYRDVLAQRADKTCGG